MKIIKNNDELQFENLKEEIKQINIQIIDININIKNILELLKK